MKLTIKSLLIVCSLLVTTAMSAQKFGYMNSALILSELPAVKQANSKLEGFNKQLQKKGQEMVVTLQNKYKSLSEKEQTGQIAPIELEKQAALLKEEENKIMLFEQKMQQDVMAKRETLLKPIYDKINAIVKAVAEENGYQYIFDVSAGGFLLYADESLDVTDIIKARL